MHSVLEYIKEYGKYSFRDVPLNEVDSLVLCQLSYMKFDGMVPSYKENRASVTLRELRESENFDRLFGDPRFEKQNKELIDSMLAGKRFRDLKLNCFMDQIEKSGEMQFSAITYILETGTAYIAFRGTDETIVGWKEDFNMAFMKTIPSQELSVRYLNCVAARIHSSFYVGGHSKGGNLAVYSAMNCNPVFQDRILKIYSMDGPGFRPEVLEQCKYDMIADRVVKFIPKSSLIGMMFESDNNYEVIDSTSWGGLAQHNAFSWVVEKDRLVRVNSLKSSSRLREKTLNKWILSVDEKQRQEFVDALYQVLAGSETDNLIDLAAEKRKSINGILAAMKELDPETSAMVKSTFKMLFEIAGEQLKEEVTRGGQSFVESTKELVKQGKAIWHTIRHSDKPEDDHK